MLLTKKIPHIKQYGLKHEIDYTLDLLYYMGIVPKDKTLYVPINRSSEEKISGIFAKSGISEDDIVVTVHPGSKLPFKKMAGRTFC